MERKAQIILFSCKNFGNISEMVPPLWLCQQKHCIFFVRLDQGYSELTAWKRIFVFPLIIPRKINHAKCLQICQEVARQISCCTPPPPGPGSTPDRKDRPDIDLVRYSRISGWSENKMLEFFYYHVSGQSCPASGHIPDMKKAGPSQPDGMKRVTN